MPSFVTELRCARCGTRHARGELHGLCSCGGPLVVDYDLDAVGRAVSRDDLRSRVPSMWRYRELLPHEQEREVVSLGEGLTPLLPVARTGAAIGLPDLWVKDDGANPTGSFKARGAACGVTMARALGVREVALPTAGNAGGAWAAYGAAAGLRVHVAMPADAPLANQLDVRAYGAELTLVDGLISDAGRLVAQGAVEHGWFDAATLKEPYRIEGKKTIGLELAEQLGWRAPDVIIYPAGGGVGLIGIWRAFAALRALGWVEGDPPRLVIVQATGCAPLVEAFERGVEESRPWQGAATIAAGLRVPKALGDFLVLRAIRETGGTAIAVEDEAMLAAMVGLGREGLLVSPEGAATLVAAERLRARGDLAAGERVVLVNTGSGLKYPEALDRALLSSRP
jgi:threonine synthase